MWQGWEDVQDGKDDEKKEGLKVLSRSVSVFNMHASPVSSTYISVSLFLRVCWDVKKKKKR